MTYGAIEAGGTKFVCAVGTGPDDVRAHTLFPTTTPAETLERTIAFFREHTSTLSALGIGAFGPVDLRTGSDTYGCILETPKPDWSYTDLVTPLHDAFEIPIALENDVNAAAIGEHTWGAAQDVDTFIYLTVGTGIGGGLMVNGECVHGLLHPEMGHIRTRRAPGDDFEGTCPFHGDCLEGMACGPAIEARWGQPGHKLPADHEAWTVQAHYLAHALVHYILVGAPQRLILGGGVMKQTQLFDAVRARVQNLLADYIRAPEVLDDIDAYIVPPGLGDRAGVLGALAMARQVAESRG